MSVAATTSGRQSVLWLVAAVVLLLAGSGLLFGSLLFDGGALPGCENNDTVDADAKDRHEYRAAQAENRKGEPVPAQPEEHERLVEATDPPRVDDNVPAVEEDVVDFSTGFRGRVVDTHGVGLPGLRIAFEQIEFDDDTDEETRSPAGDAISGEGGRYEFLFAEERMINRATLFLGEGHEGRAKDVLEPAQGEIVELDFVVEVVDLRGMVLDPAGEPVAEAEVVANYTNDHGRYQGVSQTTDAQGRFRFFERFSDTYVLTATMPGFKDSEPVTVRFDASGYGAEPVTLTLRKPYRLKVHVHSVDGEPVASARVTCTVGVNSRGHREPGLPFRHELVEQTNDAGVAMFERVPMAEGRVRIDADGYVSAVEGVSLEDAAEPNRVYVTLHGSAGIRGRLVDASGNPVGGVRLGWQPQGYLAPQLPHRPLRTDSDGRFAESDLLPAPIVLAFQGVRYGPFMLTAGETLDVGELVVDETGSVTVTLKRPADGLPPWAEAVLIPADESTQRATSARRRTSRISPRDGGGQTMFHTVLVGTYHAMVSAPGFHGQQPTKLIEVRPNAEVSVELELVAGGTVSGVVEGRTGDPIPHMVVSLVSQQGRVDRTTTSTRGAFEVRRVAPGTYRLRVGGQFDQSAITGWFEVVAGETIERVVTYPLDAIAFSLRILEHDGQPLTSASVTLAFRNLHPNGDRYQSIREAIDVGITDDQGRVHFRTVRTGREVIAYVEIDRWGEPQAFLLGSLDTQVPQRTLTVSRGADAMPGSLVGQVTRKAGGIPFNNAEITVHRVDTDGGPLLWKTAQTSSGGRFRFDKLPEGTYHVETSAAGHALETHRVQVIAGAEAQLAVQLYEVGFLFLDISLESFLAYTVIEIEVGLEGQPNTVQRQRVAVGNVITFANLRNGATYQVVIRADGHSEHRSTHTAQRGQASPIQVTLKQSD